MKQPIMVNRDRPSMPQKIRNATLIVTSLTAIGVFIAWLIIGAEWGSDAEWMTGLAGAAFAIVAAWEWADRGSDWRRWLAFLDQAE